MYWKLSQSMVMHANQTTKAWHSLWELACLSLTSISSPLSGSRVSFLIYMWSHWWRWGPGCPMTCCAGWKGVTGLGKPVELFLLTLMLIAGSDWAAMRANHKPWRWGSDYCAERQLWGSLADPMDRAQQQNNTTQNVTQTFHPWTNKTSMHLKPPHPGSKSCLVWHTLNKIRHRRSPGQAFLQGNGQLENPGPLGFHVCTQDFWTLTYKMLVQNGGNYRLCYKHNTVISFYWNSVYNSGYTCIKSFSGQQWTEFCSQIRRIPPNNCSMPHKI